MVKVKKNLKDNQETLGAYEPYKPSNMDIVQFNDIGDSIEGKFNGVKEGNFGNQINLIVEDEECFLPSIVRFNTLCNDLILLDEEFKEIWVKIEYLGKKESKNGRMFKDFDIELKKIR